MSLTSELFRSLATGDRAYAEFDVPLDDTLEDVARRVEAGPSARKHDWVHFERLLSDASQLLDRCLGYRREFMELTGAALNFLLDQTYQDTAETTLEALEASEWLPELRAFEQQRMATAGLAQRGHGAAGAAIAEGSAAASDIAARASAGERARVDAVRTKWQGIGEHRKRVRAVHEDQGGPLAYNDRARRVRVLIEQDYEEALEKLQAAAKGLETCLGIKVAQPAHPQSTPIDREVLWTREAIRSLEYDARWRETVTVVINAKDVLATPEGRVIPEASDVRHQIDAFSGFAFQLGRRHEIYEGDLVVSYGCAIEVDDVAAWPSPSFIRSQVWVRGAYYPGGSYSDAGGNWFLHYPEAPFPVYLPAVSLDRPRDETDWASPSVVANYPATGTWSFSLSRMTSGSTAHPIDQHRITNLLLYLKISRRMRNHEDPSHT